jgi:hypothetical protein
MHRSIPVPSKVLDKKWSNQNNEIHRKKLEEARPAVDSTCPDHLKMANVPAIKMSRKQMMFEGTHFLFTV